jgi:hypothetical protein
VALESPQNGHFAEGDQSKRNPNEIKAQQKHFQRNLLFCYLCLGLRRNTKSIEIMPLSHNERIKVLLHDVRAISQNKLRAAQEVNTDCRHIIDPLIQKMQAQITAFEQPRLWLNEIIIDEPSLWLHIIRLELTDAANLQDLQAHLEAIFMQLDQQILSKISLSDISPTHNDMNLRVVNALLQFQRNVGARKVFFRREQQIELDQHVLFVPLQQEQRRIQTTYREALNQSIVHATDSDVSVFERLATVIGQTSTLPDFFTYYQMQIDTMHAKLPALV